MCLILQQGLNNERGKMAILLGDIGQEWAVHSMTFLIVQSVIFLIRKKTSMTKQSSQIHLLWIGKLDYTKPRWQGQENEGVDSSSARSLTRRAGNGDNGGKCYGLVKLANVP